MDFATKQAAADAFNFLFGLAVAAGASIGVTHPHITIVGSLYGALGGTLGGLLLVYFVPRMTVVQRALAVVLSMALGFAFGPITTIFVAQWTGAFDPMDMLARIPVGALIGAFVPYLYKLFTRFIRAIENDPGAVLDGLGKAKDLMPKVTVGGKGDK